jgi:uncharacterized membrane-anchored protein
MNRSLYLLAATSVGQLLIIGFIIGMAMYPLINGVSVTLPIQNSYLSDLKMRGKYAALSYSFSRLRADTLPNDLDPKKRYNYGDRLWIKLVRKGDFFYPQGIYKKKPEGGVILKAYVESAYSFRDSAQRQKLELELRAGIEEYYITQFNAQLLEKQLEAKDSLQAVAFVKIAPNGAARIEKIEIRKIVKK